MIATVQGRQTGAVAGTPAERDEEIVLSDIVTGKEIGRFQAPGGVRGLVFAPDGRSLHGLSAQHEKNEYGFKSNFGGDPLRFDIRQPLTAVPANTAAATSAVCQVEDAVPGASDITRHQRPLRQVWTAPRSDGARIFAGKDGDIWLDTGKAIAKLDPRTGRKGRGYPKPGGQDVRTIPAPLTGGYVSYQDDTLAWRPFPGAASGAARRVIERRPGWAIENVNLQGRGIVVFWTAKEGTKVPATADGTPFDTRVVTYDASTLRPVATRRAQSDAVHMVGDRTDPDFASAYFAPCSDSAGPMRSGFDWRLSHFDSFRLLACGPGAAETKTVMWSHIDASPRRPAVVTEPGEDKRSVLAQDGHFAAARDGNVLRVFDITAKTEVGQITVGAFPDMPKVIIRATDKLIVVEVGVQRGDVFSNEVHAYSLP